jgi:beta-1,4-N-acetylglucosaminyltransferase
MKTIFVSVGSTHFDELISIIDSPEFIKLATDLGYGKIVAQTGKYGRQIHNLTDAFQYARPDEMKSYFESADLVIGHGGAGTIMEALKLGKPLLVVVNDSLMQNHQTDLAQALSDRGFLVMSGVSNFLNVFREHKFGPHQLTFSSEGFIQALEHHFAFQP